MFKFIFHLASEGLTANPQFHLYPSQLEYSINEVEYNIMSCTDEHDFFDVDKII